MAASSSNLPTPNARSVPKPLEPLQESDMVYLHTWLETDNRAEAMRAAGHVITNPDVERSMHSKIMRRIDNADSLVDLLKAAGMGQSKIITELNWLYKQKNVRFMGVALKLHAELLGLNTPQQSSGTPINVNVMQTNTSAPGNALTPNPGFVRVTIDQQKPLPQQRDENKVCNGTSVEE